MGDDTHTFQDEKVVQDLMLSGLMLGPRQSASAILARARAKRQRRTLAVSMAAAVLLCLYAVSPFVMPALARALSVVPGVGPAFKEALQLRSLDLAYEAGFMPTLDKSTERDGVMLTVHTAYRDDESFELVLSLSGEPSLIESMREGIGPRVELTSAWWKSTGHSSSKVYDEEQGVLYVTISSTDPLPWYARKPRVSVQWMTDPVEIEKHKTFVSWDDVELSQPLAVSFPLQRLTGDQVQTVPIDQAIICDETEVYLKSLTFSPARTILKYTYSGNDPVLLLLDEQGQSIRQFGEGADPSAGYITCAATESQTITIRFAGRRVESAVSVPLEEGYEYAAEPGFKIASITPTNELLPWVSPGREFYADTKVVLRWQQDRPGGVSVERGHVQWVDDGVNLLLIREEMPKNEPIRLTFMTVEGEPQQITVTR